MRRMLQRCLVLGWMGLLSMSVASAQDIEVLLDGDFQNQTGMNPNTVKGELEGLISSQLNLEEQTSYLTQMAKASAMAGRGMGVDYMVMPKRFVVGGSVGSAANGAGLISPSGELMPQGGFAWQFSGMAGLNLGALSMKDTFARRFVLLANAMTRNRSRDPFTTSSSNLGAHFQVRVIKPKKFLTAEWGGLAVTGGYERATYSMALTQSTMIESGVLQWEPEGSYTITSVSEAIPIEVSTSLRFLFLGVYGGAAVDVPLSGSGLAEVALDGDIYTDVNGNSVNVGRATVGLDNEVLMEDFVTRFFTGIQVKLAVAHAYTHFNVSTDKSVGLHMGVRVGL